MKKHTEFPDSKSTTRLSIMVLSNSKGSTLDKNKNLKHRHKEFIFNKMFIMCAECGIN